MEGERQFFTLVGTLDKLPETWVGGQHSGIPSPSLQIPFDPLYPGHLHSRCPYPGLNVQFLSAFKCLKTKGHVWEKQEMTVAMSRRWTCPYPLYLSTRVEFSSQSQD